MKFTSNNGETFDIDLGIMDTLVLMQKAIMELQEEAGKDTSAMQEAIDAWQDHLVQAAAISAGEQAYSDAIESGVDEAQAMGLLETVKEAVLSSVSSGTEVSVAVESQLTAASASIASLSSGTIHVVSSEAAEGDA